MKWSNTQGKTAMDGGFKKHGHGCPLLLTRPLPTSSSISLVKSAFSLSRKTKFYAGRAGHPLHRLTELIHEHLIPSPPDPSPFLPHPQQKQEISRIKRGKPINHISGQTHNGHGNSPHIGQYGQYGH